MHIKQKLFDMYARTLESLAAEPNCDDLDARSILLKTCAKGMREAAQGHARYEALRMLNSRQFADIWRRGIAGERLDDMVDALVRENND